MTEPVMVSIIASVPPTIVAFVTLVVAVINNRKSDKLIVKADEIHKLANANLSTVTKSLEVANTKIEGLKDVISSLPKNG